MGRALFPGSRLPCKGSHFKVRCGWRPEASGRPKNTDNPSGTTSHPRPVLAQVAQARLPVRCAWDASALGTGKNACATRDRQM